MPYFNSCVLAGYVNRPRFSKTKNGTLIVDFSLYNRLGKKPPIYIRVKAFNKEAKKIGAGDLIFLQGSIRVSKMKAGFYTYVLADRIFILNKEVGNDEPFEKLVEETEDSGLPEEKEAELQSEEVPENWIDNQVDDLFDDE